MKLLSKDYKKINKIQAIPTIVCLVIYIYALIMLMCNIISIKLPFYNLMDGTRCVMSLSAILLLTFVLEHRVPYILKKINFLIFGLLFCMSILNSDIYWGLFIIIVVLFILKKENSKSIFFSFLAIASFLMFIYAYIDYKKYTDSSLAVELIPHDSVLILIAFGLLLCYPAMSSIRKKLTSNKAKQIYNILFVLSGCIALIGCIIFLIREYLNVFTEVRYIPSAVHYGDNVLSFLENLDLKLKVMAIIALLCFLILCISFIYRRGKKVNVSNNILLSILCLYSVVFSGIYGFVFCLVCNIICFLLTYDMDRWCISYTLCRKYQYRLTWFVVAVLYISSYFLGNIVNDFILKKMPDYTITMDDIRNDEELLKGFTITEDGCIRSEELDPWIFIQWDKYGIDKAYNVNVVIKLLSNKNEKIMVYGWPLCDSSNFVVRKGKNLYSLDYLMPEDTAVRLDLTSRKNTFIMIDKIVINDFSGVGNSVASCCRKISYGILLLIIFSNIVNYVDCLIYKGERNDE